MPDPDEPSRQSLEAHVAAAWPGAKARVSPATAHAREVLPDLAILRLEPGSPGAPWVYATLGAWAATKELDEGLEFVLLSPREDERHVETLSSVAYYHAFYGHDEGSIYRVARGWFFESSCDRFLFAALSELRVGSRRVRVLRCVPVTPEEAETARDAGAKPLLERFEARGVNLLDPARKSIV